MGTWNNLQEGFTVDERLPDTLVDVAVWHVTGRLVSSLMLMPPPLKRLAREVLFSAGLPFSVYIIA